jgi:preprotein translocase subunit Sss1
MSREFLQGFLRAGVFLTLTSLFLMFVTKPDSAEFVISVLSLLIGLALMGGVIFVLWLAKR